MSCTYLITGGAGFIGRHLTAELLAAGHAVRVVDALIPQVHDRMELLPDDSVSFIQGDVRNEALLARALKGVDGVFHLAAEVGVGQSMYELARYVGANDLGTAVLLQAVVKANVRRIVVASSMSVYGEGAYDTADGVHVEPAQQRSGGTWDPVDRDGRPLVPRPTDETKRLDLASIYALTKYVQERSCLITGAAYGFEAVALRLFNVFGPGQALSNPYTGVLANFGARLLNRQRPIVFEDGCQRRDFVHVRDVARAFCLAMESGAAAGHVINIGSGRVYMIRHVAEMLGEAMGVPELGPETVGKRRAGDIRHCFADIGKARQLLGYAPTAYLEDTLDELCAWIRTSDAPDFGDLARRQLETRGLVA